MPEKGQPLGQNAKQLTSDLCFGKIISAEKIDIDDTMEEWLLRYTYDKSALFTEMEKEAHLNNRGLWAAPNPIAPWEWRKGVR